VRHRRKPSRLSSHEGSTKLIQRYFRGSIRHGIKWEEKIKKLRGRSNGVIGGYHKWLKSRTQGITWLQKLKGMNGKEAEVPKESEEVQILKVELEKTKVTKEKLKVVVTRVKKECNRLKDVITAK